MRLIFILFTILPLLLLSTPAAWAGQTAAAGQTVDADLPKSDVYKVSKVHVDVSASTAVEAMDTAKKDGVRTAFVTLFNRLVFMDEWSKMPPYNPEVAAKAIDKLEVNNEKISSTRYVADMTISFNAEYMRKYLTEFGFHFSDTQAPLMGLLVISNTTGEVELCIPRNAWCRAWQALDLTDSITPLILIDNPQASFQDKNIANRIASKSTSVLDEIAMHYNVSSLIIVSFTTSVGKIDISLEHYMPLAGFVEKVNTSIAPAPAGTTAPYQAKAMLSTLEDMWKTQRLKIEKVKQESQFTMNLEFNFASIDEWRAMEKAFKEVKGVSDFQVTAVGVSGASAQVHYTGSLSTLARELNKRHVLLTRENENLWIAKPLKDLLPANVQAAGEENKP